MTLRILHIDCGREWRGGQRQALLLAVGQRERGSEPLVAGQPASPLVQRARASGVAVAAVRMRGVWDVAAVGRLRALIRTWRPDVVHAHDARAHTLAIAALLRRAGDIPLVVTRRAPLDRRVIGVRYGRRVARFIAISRAVRDSMIECGVRDDRVEVVYAGVPTARVEAPRDWRAECRWPQDAVVCGVVGPLTGERAATLEAVAHALPDGVRASTRLLLLGGGSTGPCEVGGLTAFGAGHVDAMADAMAGLDLLWHPARAEGLGTVIVDAMALGVPPVCFGVGALPELIEHERTGLVVPAHDVAAFAAAASRLIADARLRRHMADAGPARAANFESARTVAQVERIYLALLAATSPAERGTIA
ncbi:MAG TPA: glycosyltransferase family 4 protein [Gemmatimonadaceae bacterium]|nr:glycosyltransferase family 4 protein [Gemmatimonadaceae bacterium]